MSKKLKMWPMRRPLDWQIVPLIGIIDDIKPKPILSIISETTKPIIKTVEPALPKARTSIENPPQARAAEPLQARAAEPLLMPEAEPLLMPEAEPLLMPEAEPLLMPEAEPHLVPEAEPHLMPAAEPSVDKQMVLQLAMEAEEAKKKATELFNASLKQRQAEILRQVAAKKEEERKEAEALALQVQAADALKVAELQNAERMRIQLEKEAEQLLFEEAKQKQIELDLAMQKAVEEEKEAKEKARQAADINIYQPRQNVELSGTDVPTNMRPTNMRPANMRPTNINTEKGAKVEFKPLMADSQLNAIERIVKARGDKVSDSIANYPRGPNKPHREGKEFRPANKKGGTRKIKKKTKKTKKKIYKTKKDKNIKTRKNVTKKYTIKKKDARRFNSRK
jgi:hypothetical protein